MQINRKTKALLIGIIAVTAFLFPIGVRAPPPPAITSVTLVSSIYSFGGFTINPGVSQLVASIVVTIPNGHSATVSPHFFGANIGETGSSSASYVVQWQANSTVIGDAVATCISTPLPVAFGAVPNNSAQNSFITSSHAGPVSYTIAIYVQSSVPSNSTTTISVGNPYVNVLVAQT